MRRCFQCGQEIAADRTIARDEECPHCSSDLHCCRNCRFYDTAVSHQCREPQADWVIDKVRANFCEFFSFIEGARPQAAQEDTTSARDRFNKLFRD
jgi:hypothetical protein